MTDRLLFPTLEEYRSAWLRKDALAGVAAGAVVIPQAMAYSTIADLPVQVGLYTCILPLIVYAALGGSRAMSVSTTSTIATLTATTLVTAGVAASGGDTLANLVTLTLLVGVILAAARLLKLGSLIENISEATLVGMKVGLGLTVALGQVPRLLGVDVNPTGRGFIRTVIATVEAVPQANPMTVAVSLGTIAVLVLAGRLTPRIPAQLLVVVGGIALVAITPLASFGVDLVGAVPQGLPRLVLPAFGDIGGLLPGALAIALMAFLETASVARSLRREGEPRIDSDRELLAIGAVNLVGAMSGTLPAAGGFSQSAVNQRAGARTQAASLVTAALAVLTALFLAPILANLPEAVLAAVVIVAVVGLIDVRGLVRMFRISRAEFWIALVTAMVGLSAGLLAAVATGVVLTLGSVLRELSRAHISGSIDGTTLTVRLAISLYTASVQPTRRAIEELIDDVPVITDLVIDATAMRLASLTVIDPLAEFDRELATRSITLHVSGLSGQPLELARQTDWGRGRLPPASGGGG